MGIQGLLQGLKFVTTPGNITDYKGQAVCVDGSSWLHKSVYSIAEHYVECIEQKGLDRRCINVASSYIKARCDELLNFAQVRRIYFVMDGKRCPLKAGTNADRDNRREDNLKEARRLKQRGDNDGAYEKYKACIKITDRLTKEVAASLARAFPDGRVELVHSPYEADPQLVKLCIDGHCSAIITEDSDVLVYCAAARQMTPVLFKLDRKNGQCQVVSMAWLLCPNNNLSLRAQPTDPNKKKRTNGIEATLEAFAAREAREPGLGVRLFVQACILSGCDYAVNELEGVGLVNAFKAIRSAIHRSDDDRFRHAMTLLPSKACKSIDKIEYEELLAKSEAVFYHHPVMESTGRVVYLVDSAEHGSHFPVLERFGGDILFIGDVLPSNELLQDSTNLPPVSEIVVKHKSKSGRETRRAAKVSYDEGLRRTKEVAPMLNPYLNAKKRGQDGSQKQTDAAAQLAGKRNPFASFVVKGKENEKWDNEVARRSNHKLKFVESAAKGIGVKAFLDKLLPPPHQEQKPLPRERATIHESQSERSTRHHQHDYDHELPNSDKYSEVGTKRQRLSEPACQQLHDYGSRQQPIDLDNMLEQDAHSHQAGLYEQINAFEKSSCDSEYISQEPAHPSFRRYNDERHGQSYPAHKAPSTFYDLCGSETVTDQSSRTMNRPLSHADTTLSYRSSVHSSVRRDDLDDVSVVRRQGILPLQPSEGLLDPHAQHTQSSSSNVPPINAADNQDPFDVQDRSFSLSQDVPLFNRHIHDMAGTCLADTNECPRRITNEFAKSLYPPPPLAMPAASPRKQRPSFAYDEWLESPQTKDQIMNARELQADDILSSPESFSMRPSNSTNPDRPLIMATNTIGPAKTFRNRFQSTNPQGARKGLIPVRAKQRNGPLQGSLSRYFSRRN